MRPLAPLGEAGLVDVKVLAHFDTWMAHCHNLDHADRGMMTVLRVLDR